MCRAYIQGCNILSAILEVKTWPIGSDTCRVLLSGVSHTNLTTLTAHLFREKNKGQMGTGWTAVNGGMECMKCNL